MAPPQKRIWSNYQKKIFVDIAKGTGNTVVIARAGSGKTTTIVEGFKFIPRGKKTLMAAFNKIIAEELKARAPSYVECCTLHSLGYRAVRLNFGNTVTLDNRKMSTIFETMIGDDWDLNMQLCKCASLCKGFLWDSPAKITELIEKFGIDTGELKEEQFIKYVIQALGYAKSQKQIVDFDDMIWFPFIYNLNVGKYDYVFVDEAQDLNAAQIAMSLSAVKADGRIIAVGDPHQSIYQFRGADSEAIPNIVARTNAKTLPLSVSYRCPKLVIELAQQVVPDIEHSPDAPLGVVEYMMVGDLLKSVSKGDFVLSRTNAPLVKYCMALLKIGVPANIQGRDIGANLNYFIKKSKCKTIETLIKYIEKWRKTEVARLIVEKKDVETCNDKAETLTNLCEDISTIKELKDRIDALFDDTDDHNKVIFSTTHKAKGLERDRVFVLSWTYRSKGAGGGEESNLWYVAITRAKKELYIVQKVKT